jgi:predicted dehydrogenase
MAERKRYAVVGTGGRSRMYIDAMSKPDSEYRQWAELVGLCDLSPTRMAYYNELIEREYGHDAVPTFHADAFDRMIEQTKPDVVIVTTMDATHHRYIIRAMELGCDAITEKPMTTDAAKARAIFDAIERTGRDLRVTFNYRYAPPCTKLREIVMEGTIGTPTSVDFQWMLDTSHGADYFRRWHREKECSGGLLVHKSTHHFDLVNWWIDSTPQTVFALGDLMFYGRRNAARRGEQCPYERYTGEAAAADDPFAIDLQRNERMKRLYLDAEADSGYVRDRNVFGEPITVEDTHAVTARYRNGVILSYHMHAYCPWEGERVAINGTEGRVEYFSRGKGHIISGQTDAELAEEQYAGEKWITVQRMFEPRYAVEIPRAVGGHGGGDKGVLDRIFPPDPPADPFGRDATHIDGARSILLGIAAERAIETGLPVHIDDLLQLPD